MAYETVRDINGDIYADVGSAQLRRIPSLTDYQQGVAQGTYSGTPRQLPVSSTGQSAPAPGAGGMTYLGGYEVGPNISLADASAGNVNFATPSRGVTTTPGGGTGIAPSGGSAKASAFANATANLIQHGSLAGQQQAGGSRMDEIARLRQKVGDVQQQAFERRTEYTPANLRNLTPGQQAELRRQRVTALSAEMGNYQSAIQTLKDEEEAAKDEAEKQREYAIDSLNTYLKYGVLDQLSEDEQKQLAASTGMSAAALKKIQEQAAAGEPPELREVGGSLYALAWNAEKGTYDTQLVLAKPAGSGSGGGGGGSGTSSKFSSRGDKFRGELALGKISWASAFNEMKREFPSADDSDINSILAGSVDYNAETGEFSNPQGLADPGNVKGSDALEALKKEIYTEIKEEGGL